MYKVSHYNEKDKAKIFDFISKNPFAFLSGSTSQGKPVATQLPLLINKNNDEWILQGHIMKNTDHYKTFVDNPNVLAVFTGPHAYVSGTWYENPKVASTWNYMSVHAGGVVSFMTNEKLIAFMKKLTLHFENDNPDSETIYNNLPKSFLERTMHAIVGIEIRVKHLDAIFKLSQDKDEQSIQNIIKALKQKSYMEKWLAEEMSNNS